MLTDGEKLAEAAPGRGWLLPTVPWERGLSAGPGAPEWSFLIRKREGLWGKEFLRAGTGPEGSAQWLS